MQERGITGRPWPPFFSVVAVLLTILPGTSVAATPYLRIQSDSYGGPVSVWGAIHGWKGDFHSGDQEWTRNWVEAGVRFNRWSIGALYRYDLSLRFSSDAARLYYALANHQQLPEDAAYQVSVNANGFAAQGLRAAFQVSSQPTLSAIVGLSLFHASQLQYGSIEGVATTLSPRDYNYQAAVDYRFSHDKLFGFAANPPRGYGASLDLSLSGFYQNWFNWHFDVEDLFGMIHWTDVPHTLALASSEQKHYDSQGYVHIDPLLSGTRRVEHSFNQELHPKFEAGLTFFRGNEWQPLVNVRHLYGTTLIGLGFATRAIQTGFEFSYWPKTRTARLTLSRNSWHFGLGVTPGSIGLHQTGTLWLEAGIGQL